MSQHPHLGGTTSVVLLAPKVVSASIAQPPQTCSAARASYLISCVCKAGKPQLAIGRLQQRHLHSAICSLQRLRLGGLDLRLVGLSGVAVRFHCRQRNACLGTRAASHPWRTVGDAAAASVCLPCDASLQRMGRVAQSSRGLMARRRISRYSYQEPPVGCRMFYGLIGLHPVGAVCVSVWYSKRSQPCRGRWSLTFRLILLHHSLQPP